MAESSSNTGVQELTQIKNCVTDCATTNTQRAASITSIISYFIEAIAADNEATKHYKSLNELPYQLFKDRNLQKISVRKSYNVVFVVCVCLPEKRKDSVCEIFMRLQQTKATIKMPDADRLPLNT